MTRLIDLPTLARLVHSGGMGRFLELLADRIAADFGRNDQGHHAGGQSPMKQTGGKIPDANRSVWRHGGGR